MTPGPLVLVVEDEPPMRRFLRTSLSARGFRVIEAANGHEALIMTSSHNPELTLLDLGLPDRDGVELTAELRGLSRAPILVVSARGREEDKVAALDAGADDYLIKPFGVNELYARMRVALRHARDAVAPPGPSTLELGDLSVDLQRRLVTRAGQEVHLTPIEYRLLALLAANAGRVLTHGQILREVWGEAHAGDVHCVRVHMADLRKKLEDEPARPRVLLTEPGVGYRLREPR